MYIFVVAGSDPALLDTPVMEILGVLIITYETIGR